MGHGQDRHGSVRLSLVNVGRSSCLDATLAGLYTACVLRLYALFKEASPSILQ